MGLSVITYNGFTFPDRSNITIDEQFVYDEADWTVTATRFRLKVQTIIINEENSQGYEFNSAKQPDEQWQIADRFAAPTMQRARQSLSKPGQILEIRHDGFSPHWYINDSLQGIRDISWGPKPRFIRWVPVGHTHAVEVEWECDFEIPICDGLGESPAFRGLASHNYSINFKYDSRGYTTRTISGSLSVAMTRVQGQRTLPDTVDLYRNRIAHTKPDNFTREVDWSISADKRTANYTITDKEIASPNAWPAGVVDIRAMHRVRREVKSLGKIENTLNVSIELSPTEHKSRAWMIFRGLVDKRQQYILNKRDLFLKELEIDDDIFSNRIGFYISYHFLSGAEDGSSMISESGVFQPVSDNLDSWRAWDQSIKHLTPLRGIGFDYAKSGLGHQVEGERITDLCNQVTNVPIPYGITPTPYVAPSPALVNEKPLPSKSYLKYQAAIQYETDEPAYVSVELRGKDLQYNLVSSDVPSANLPQPAPEGAAKRWIEERAGSQMVTVIGHAERVGYQVPHPGKIKIGGVLYRPIGKGAFITRKIGDYFGQPVFEAAWKQRYQLAGPLLRIDDGDEEAGAN
ncbi:hypothetical protein VN12_11705 [Pirellula sp. SH-Sr6A]|uniref:hypothetical protein n=1 Tax=Pirellula sp. SH-Sr6A TaxID=1632865 RepID=UPI00078B7DC8|nr:hypothetical protein [Pirellula sp. SH-Sr6A]AMV32782.1 hypothetical protein VN12_11705 [Pirellula sp. SH-Sr6A]